jgi:hypothetical protein
MNYNLSSVLLQSKTYPDNREEYSFSIRFAIHAPPSEASGVHEPLLSVTLALAASASVASVFLAGIKCEMSTSAAISANLIISIP